MCLLRGICWQGRKCGAAGDAEVLPVGEDDAAVSFLAADAGNAGKGGACEGVNLCGYPVYSPRIVDWMKWRYIDILHRVMA